MNLIANPAGQHESSYVMAQPVAYPTPCFFLHPLYSRAPLRSKGDYAVNSGACLVGSSVEARSDNGPTRARPRDTSGWMAIPGAESGAADCRPAALVSMGTGMPLAGGSVPFNGIVFQRSEVTMAMISDGTSNTYLVGVSIAA